MTVSFATLFSVFFALAFVVQASPVNLIAKSALDVWVPRIISPNSMTVWVIGKNATVVWDTSDAPASISNAASVVLHGYGTLAQGFNLRVGNVTFKVPCDVKPGPSVITLFGDSGNFSPTFNITTQLHLNLGQ